MPALCPRDVRDAAQGPDPHRAALARHLSNAINAESRRWTPRGVALGFGLALAYVLLQVFASLAGLTRFPVVVPVLRIGGLVAVVLISRADSRRRVGSFLANTAVAEGLCGGCSYSLRDLPEEPDGCIVCPECGAAWQARRITRPHWLAPGAARSRAEGGRAGINWFYRFITLTPPPSQLIAPDDRGRFVSIVDSRLWLADRARREELGPMLRRDLRSELRAVGRAPRVLVALLPGLGAVFFGMGLLGSAPNAVVSTVMAGGLLLFGSLIVGVLFSHAFYSTRRAARVLVAASRCPSCLYPLQGLPLDADGCVVCPECGSSWRPPTIGQ